MVMLPVASAQEIDSFPRSKWGIPEPELDPEKPDGTYSGKIDVVIVPGVAFDEGCNRLGHGKGYYGESPSGRGATKGGGRLISRNQMTRCVLSWAFLVLRLLPGSAEEEQRRARCACTLHRGASTVVEYVLTSHLAA